jgi:hypothetical protein
MTISLLILPVLVRIIAITVALRDFVYIHGMVFQFDLPESLGLLVVLAGFFDTVLLSQVFSPK